MNRTVKKVGILFGIFAVALLLLFLGSRRNESGDQAVYTVLGEASLPGVSLDMYGREMNNLVGYRREIDVSVASELLTVLPEDRALPVTIVEKGDAVLGISYEVRSMDRERLVERTHVENWERNGNQIRTTLPIQNLLSRDQEYLLRITLTTQEHGEIYYYTRILGTEDEKAQSMIDLAVEFSAKTFNYDQARDLVTYLETNSTEDNSSFGSTSIQSSFSQLTWGRLKMQPVGTVQVKLKELDGIMCTVQLSYLAGRESQEELQETYEVEETFTMKWNELRTYMMDYKRVVNQVFQGNRQDYSGKRILLGITNDDRVEVKKSPNQQVFAYRVNRDLWSYRTEGNGKTAVKVFSFRTGSQQDETNYSNRHDIKILSVSDEGDIDFLVYGYMSHGHREGDVGIAGYRYTAEDNGLKELFFIPYTGGYEQMESDLSQLVYSNPAQMLYLYLDHAVYGIDLNSRENMVVADALEEGSLAVSTDSRRIAWQEGGTLYQANGIHLMDLETGEKHEIRGEENEKLRTLGFVGRDLVYGIARETDIWLINGRVADLPMYGIHIINDHLEEETSYEKNGFYVSGVRVEESRIHLNRLTKLSDNRYTTAEEDTIVCNVDMGPGKLDGIGWYASQDKGKVYFVQLEGENTGNTGIRTQVPRRITYEDSDLSTLKSNFQISGMRFYAYGNGHLQKSTMNFAEAVQAAYDQMGYVTDQNHHILWNRASRGNIRNIKDPLVAFGGISRHLEEFTQSRSFNDGMVLLDARGCTMMQVLYFIDQGIPVMGYTEEGQYLILCGFDQYNVTVYNPVTGETYKAGLNDSTEYFRLRGNDFICAIQLP